MLDFVHSLERVDDQETCSMDWTPNLEDWNVFLQQLRSFVPAQGS